ncbi:MAG: hypothetical protein ACFFB5_05675 [Promethearchaeota archaeon]
MSQISRINQEKIIGFWLLTSIYLVIILIAITPGIATPLKTSTTLLSDIGAAGLDDTIQFTIFVYTGFDPVPTGVVRIIDTNTSEYIDTTILGGEAKVNWTVFEPFIEGVHVFKANYQGFLDYSPSSGICSIYFDEFTPGSSRTTTITLNSNSTVVFKNSSVRFTVELEIINSVQPYFKGGYIYVKNNNLSGSPMIHTYGPLPLDPSALLTYSFDYQIPIFSPVGINAFFVEYTGSSQSQTKPCTSSHHNITVLSTGFWLDQSIDQVDLQREESTLELNTTILGDNPIGLELKMYSSLNDQKFIIDDRILESRNVITYFLPNSSVPVGILSIITELIDPSTKTQYTNTTTAVSIIDYARIDHSENATQYRHNESIRIEAYITEQDVWTHPVVTTVELQDVTDGNRSLINKTTNQDGFVVIDYPIPDNATVGNHKFSLTTHNTNKFILDITETFLIPIKGITEIDVTYESGGVDRNEITLIEATVLSGGVAISEGLIVLEFAINDSVIETRDCEPGLEFEYFIEPSHPRGIMEYQIHFLGSYNYDEHVEPIDLPVFSNPTFSTSGQNASEVIKGHTVRIWGRLVDEIGQPVCYEEIELTDTTIGTFLGTSVTDDQGLFFYDYFISQSTQIGVHFVEITYSGNILEFYRASTNNPLKSITVRPPLSVMIEAEVVANHWTIISLEGGLNDDILLEWQKYGEIDWSYLGVVVLNSSGRGLYNWSTPYYKGEFAIRATGPNSTKYDFSTMYAIPYITVAGDEIGNVNDPYLFTVNSAEKYQIWISEQLWQDWREAGIHQYDYIFTGRGLRGITIVSNDTYTYYQEYHHNIAIYEDVFVTLSAPLEAFVNLSINLDGTVIGEVSGPIEGMDATLVVNGTDLQVDSTSGAGHYYFSVVFEDPGNYKLMVKTPSSDTTFYCASFSEESNIFINSIPADFDILSPLNQTYGAIVEVSIVGDAENYWYCIEPIDITNISWFTPIYRTLPEGNYTCHVYGQNNYGIVSHIYSPFIVDTTAPSLILTSPRNTTYTINDISISYLTDENEVLVVLDDVELEGVSSGTLLSGLAEGVHNLTILAYDQVGNMVDRIALFRVDTVPPSLEISSPYNQSYTTEIEIILRSNGSTVLYYIPTVHKYNQTYTDPISLNLSIGKYILQVYAFDDAGNTCTGSVAFSIVQTIELLINPKCKDVDGAGNYEISTQIMSHPNFDLVGIYLNGTYLGSLNWSYLYQDYRLSFQLERPGLWQLTLFAKTTLEEYDFHYFEIEWNPPVPLFKSVSVAFDSSQYEVRAQIDTGVLSLDRVLLFVNDTSYPLTYSPFGDRWVVNIPVHPKNDTLIFYTWYKWDELPSAHYEHYISWFAPSIILEESIIRRENFSLSIRIEKQNASIVTQSVKLLIINGSSEIDVVGNLVYESVTGSYQQWEFNSPNLPPRIWNYRIKVRDIYGSQRVLNLIFNATDLPPQFGNSAAFLVSRYTAGELWQIEVAASDDYQIERVILYVDGIDKTSTTNNDTHFVFQVWLTEGVHSLQVAAYDDIGQKNTLDLPSIEVILIPSTTSSTTPIETRTSDSSFPRNTNSSTTSNSDEEADGLITLGFAGSIVGGIVMVGNIVARKRRD